MYGIEWSFIYKRNWGPVKKVGIWGLPKSVIPISLIMNVAEYLFLYIYLFCVHMSAHISNA